MIPANLPADPPLPQPSTRITEEAAHLIIRSSRPVWAFDNVGEVATVAVFPDRRRMATSSSDGVLRVWDINNGALLKELEGSSDTMGHMALSRDGQLIASCDDEGYVNAWHGDTGRPLTQSFKAHSRSCSLDFSPDGATLATGSLDCTTKLWSTITWQRLQSGLIECNSPVNFVRYSPNGKLLAIATNQDVQIWNTVTKQHVVYIGLTVVVSLGQGCSSSSCYPSYSLVWTPDGTRLLSMCNPIIREWDSSTWKPLEVGGLWRGQTGIAVSCDGTLVAYATTDNHVRVKRLSDRRTIAIFQHSDSPCSITFSMDGRHILAGGKGKKIFQWAVPQHAWPGDAPTDQATYQVQECDAEVQGSQYEILTMNTEVRNACISGDLTTAEELLTKAIDANVNNYRPYAVRSVVMARKLDWDHALRDATKSISIQPSLMGYISKGIALCGKGQVWNANKALDLAFTFTNGDSKTIHSLFLIKAIVFFHANRHADAMRRVRELAATCSIVDTTLACRVVEVYLHIQLGNNAWDRDCPTEAAIHFTAAVNAGTFLTKSDIDSKYEDFVVLFGCDFTSLWQTANQKRCHALFRAGRLVEVFEACQYMADMSDESTKASCLDWTIDFMREMSTFRVSAPKGDATHNIMVCKYEDDDTNDSISDIDSDIDRVDDVDC